MQQLLGRHIRLKLTLNAERSSSHHHQIELLCSGKAVRLFRSSMGLPIATRFLHFL